MDIVKSTKTKTVSVKMPVRLKNNGKIIEPVVLPFFDDPSFCDGYMVEYEDKKNPLNSTFCIIKAIVKNENENKIKKEISDKKIAIIKTDDHYIVKALEGGDGMGR